MGRPIPPVTRLILILNVAVFLLELSGANFNAFALWPIGGGFAPWQILTYGFLHASPTHVLFNMFAVYMFGGTMEYVWGGGRFLIYYLGCIVSAALAQVAVDALIASPYPTIGASGGVFGILLAFAMYFPRQRVMLLIPPIPMPAWLFVTLYGALELYLGVTGTQAGVAHFAHLGGMLGGWLMIRRWRGRREPAFTVEAPGREDY
ncbi:rhomboid family intramembrane serine protease [bacterium]|nr:rhomboid family intramembrane serine protease [bacterium]